MSRVSQKSQLSPSITKGSNAIDLGKNSGVDMGRKTQPSATSGGIGITQEVTSIAGVSVSAGVNVDITPVDFGITVNPEGTVSIATGAEIPGGLLGVSGGIEIDTNTGQVIGGSLGAEIGGLGINISNSQKGGLGIEFTVQIPGTPIELSLGFGFPPKEPTPSSPSPSPTDTPPPPPTTVNCSTGSWIVGGYGAVATKNENVFLEGDAYLRHLIVGIKSNFDYYTTGWDESTATFYANSRWGVGNWEKIETEVTEYFPWHTASNPPQPAYVGEWYYRNNDGTINHGGIRINQYGSRFWIKGMWTTTVPTYKANDNSGRFYGASYDWKSKIVEVLPAPPCPTLPTPTPTPTPSSSPFPNPPPRKRNMDICCAESIKLQRLIVRHLGATSSPIKETLPDGVKAIGSAQDGIRQAYPFEVKKRWIDPTVKEDETIQILNDRQLALVLGGMIERLERTLGTAEFYKDSDKKLRQSEGNLLSWLTGKNKDFNFPDPNDFWLNTDDGIINEKVLEVRSLADGIRYQIEALNRLERILPIAELKDSSIPARWIYPNGKGQLRVGNLIHLCEYMIRKSDKDMGYWPQKITIKAANPAIKDDEPITTDVHSQADMLRVILQQILDIEGDGDMGSNYDLRRTYLDVMAFQMLTKNNKYLQAISEYLSFDMIEEVSKIPIPFDPFAGQDRSTIEEWWIKFGFGEQKLDFPTKNTESEIEQLSEGLLQNSELEVGTVKFGSLDERKDPKTLKEALIEILKHSSASAAAVTEVASEGALERIVDAAGLAQKLTSFLLRKDIRESLGIGDLDNWMASAEKGYTDNSGTESLRFPESNPFEPYGRPATQNPVIREIDTKEAKAD
jgi:hypothetical protein